MPTKPLLLVAVTPALLVLTVVVLTSISVLVVVMSWTMLETRLSRSLT